MAPVEMAATCSPLIQTTLLSSVPLTKVSVGTMTTSTVISSTSARMGVEASLEHAPRSSTMTMTSSELLSQPFLKLSPQATPTTPASLSIKLESPGSAPSSTSASSTSAHSAVDTPVAAPEGVPACTVQLSQSFGSLLQHLSCMQPQNTVTVDHDLSTLSEASAERVLETPITNIPVHATSAPVTQTRSHPLQGVGNLSFATVYWMGSVLMSLTRKELDIDTFRLPHEDATHTNAKRLQNLWEDEVKKVGLEKASVGRVMLRSQRKRLLLATLCSLAHLATVFLASGILINDFVKYLNNETATLLHGGILCVILATLVMSRVFLHSASSTIGIQTAGRMKVAFTALGFQKIMSLKGNKDICTGKMINVLITESYKLYELALFAALMLPALLMFIIMTIYATYILGYSFLIGAGIVCSFAFMQSVLSKVCSWLLGKVHVITDSKGNTIKEILSSMKAIKMYVWEKLFQEKITGIRNKEANSLTNVVFIQNYNGTIGPMVPTIAIAITFILHTQLGYPLNIHTGFPVLAVMNCVKILLALVPAVLKFSSETSVAMKRMKSIMQMKNPEPYIQVGNNESPAIIMDNATLSWEALDNDTQSQTGSSRNQPALSRISFSLPKGKLLGICGTTGCGKTSLICSILEQLHLQQGSVSVNGTIAYAAQEAWIFYGTIKENILMGEPLDEARYIRVIHACCLKTDLDKLPMKDKTMLEEQGANLSGGQKQRVSLARALYSNRDIFLLDDPLSAVDARVGKQIFEQVIKEELKDKTVILVTHQLQYMEFCDEVLVLKDGTVLQAGSHEDLMTAGGYYFELVTEHQNKQYKPQNVEQGAELNRHQDGAGANPADSSEVERTREGLISWTTISQYFQAAGGFFTVFLIIIFVLMVATTATTSWWISNWLQQGHRAVNLTCPENVTCPVNVTYPTDGNVTLNPNLHYYQWVCGVLLAVMMALTIIKSICFVKLAMCAATTLHNNLLSKILKCPMSYFDTTPTGQIINCFTRDQDEMDTLVPHFMNIFIMYSLTILSSVIMALVLAYPNPWIWVTVGTIILFLLYFRKLERKILDVICQLKKKEGDSRSFCISLCTSVTQGLSTIHVYNKKDHYIDLFKKLSDTNINHQLLLGYGSRWCCTVLDFGAGILAVGITTAVLLFPYNSSVAMKTLALIYAGQLTGMCQYWISNLVEMMARFSSVERILETTAHCRPESGPEIEQTPVPDDWPQAGAITFRNYTMKYRPCKPIVLHDLQLHIGAKEKLGIVGRTGSGKSSLAVALFRLVEPTAGHIVIDGIDITTISPTDLRNKLSFIPQHPVLFTETVRFNLDPFSRYSDEEIWAALEKTHMKNKIDSLEGKLQAAVKVNGENLSGGQKQLLCLARALLQHAKIIILDEATASIDEETDSYIQHAITETFQDCTVLTIAHRLNTVMQSDRILVMDSGRVAELDHPDILKQRLDSHFAYLLTANTV
ncbi:multidrug resistance-associated protein 9-like [Thalassophryne amazonica]|uniref:multidrug resistance-associated protein 9-like n=1 Tax=Thalassophryne amazonica TaxID=390379 RepID=UPI0014712532|nr:multidrug resistance-associated protein 9-like [Thalassophryne amazonica]